jgi:hypothetical protein
MALQIKTAIRFPFEQSDAPRKLLIGGATGLLLQLIFVGLAYFASEEAAFGIAPLAVMVNLPVFGYAVLAYEDILRHEDARLPEWEDWPRLFSIGLVGFGIAAAYGIVPLLFLLFGLGLLVKGGVMLLLGMILMVLGVLAGVFVLFFLPVALAAYLVTRRLEAVFHPRTLWGGIDKILGEYAATYLLCLGLLIGSGMIAAVPYLGALTWPFLWFYLLLVVAHLFGRACAQVF